MKPIFYLILIVVFSCSQTNRQEKSANINLKDTFNTKIIVLKNINNNKPKTINDTLLVSIIGLTRAKVDSIIPTDTSKVKQSANNVNVYCGKCEGDGKSDIIDILLDKLLIPLILSILTSFVIVFFKYRDLTIKQKELRIMFETENYKELYKIRLEALKELRNILFKNFTTSIPLEHAEISDVYKNISLNADTITKDIKAIITNYGYLFSKSVYEKMMSLHILTNDVGKAMQSFNDDELIEKGKEINNDLESITSDIESLLQMK